MISCKNCNTLSDMLYWLCCPSPFWQQKGVDIMDTILTNFLVAVAAQVAATIFASGLIDTARASKHKKNPLGAATLRGLFFVRGYNGMF